MTTLVRLKSSLQVVISKYVQGGDSTITNWNARIVFMHSKDMDECMTAEWVAVKLECTC